jgi:nicotinate-nucleotide adenylyltransferase
MRTLVKSIAGQRAALPPHAPGLRIGLFGGSFNPPHEAHREVSLLALKRLALDRLWWLVTPGNPLKDTKGLPPVEERVAAAQRLANHPRIDATGFEAVVGLKYSCDTITYLLKECPGVRFVWIMGADNLKGFHRWKNWRAIFGMIPIAVVDRGGISLQATSGPAAIHFARARIPENQAMTLADREPPAWVYLHGIKSTMSSTGLRAAKKGGSGY